MDSSSPADVPSPEQQAERIKATEAQCREEAIEAGTKTYLVSSTCVDRGQAGIKSCVWLCFARGGFLQIDSTGDAHGLAKAAWRPACPSHVLFWPGSHPITVPLFHLPGGLMHGVATLGLSTMRTGKE